MDKKEFYITSAIFVVIFLALIIFSVLGYGAPRYHSKTYHNDYVFFSSGNYTYSPSARVGSVGGPGVQGGGLHGGK